MTPGTSFILFTGGNKKVPRLYVLILSKYEIHSMHEFHRNLFFFCLNTLDYFVTWLVTVLGWEIEWTI